MFEPNKSFKNFLSFFENNFGRLKKYIELLTLKIRLHLIQRQIKSP